MNIEIILMIITITITCALALFALWTFIRYRREIDQVPGPPIHSLLSGNLNLFLKPKELSIKQYVICKFPNDNHLLLYTCVPFNDDDDDDDELINLFLVLFFTIFYFGTKDIYDLLLEFCNQYRSEGVFRLWFGPFHSMFILTNVQCVEVRCRGFHPKVGPSKSNV